MAKSPAEIQSMREQVEKVTNRLRQMYPLFKFYTSINTDGYSYIRAFTQSQPTPNVKDKIASNIMSWGDLRAWVTNSAPRDTKASPVGFGYVVTYRCEPDKLFVNAAPKQEFTPVQEQLPTDVTVEEAIAKIMNRFPEAQFVNVPIHRVQDRPELSIVSAIAIIKRKYPQAQIIL